MMSDQMVDLVMAKANEMADHDGSPFDVIYVVGAVNALQVELLAARDLLLRPGAEIVVPVAPAAAPLAEGSEPAPDLGVVATTEAAPGEAAAEPAPGSMTGEADAGAAVAPPK